MTREDNNKICTIIRQRLKDLHPENCEYCGGYHELVLSRSGISIIALNMCCDEILRQANRIIRETRKECGDPYYQ